MPDAVRVPMAGTITPTAKLRHTLRPGLVVRLCHARFEVVPEILS